MCTGIYNPRGESGILWDDPAIGINWPTENPILSDKDRTAQSLSQWLESKESNQFQYSKKDNL
jgi:dTDP-4-dehydrorhamnose 3,5-epimerase